MTVPDVERFGAHHPDLLHEVETAGFDLDATAAESGFGPLRPA
ncbi:hypothetical protein ACFWNL_18175 [Kitasatospora sp. NPDC058397]